jgi:hypothetical protein
MDYYDSCHGNPDKHYAIFFKCIFQLIRKYTSNDTFWSMTYQTDSERYKIMKV